MSNTLDYQKVLLAIMLWREARGESFDAKVCVAATALNRVEMQGWAGRDLVEVITKKWQYSSMTDPKDPQLTSWPQLNDKSFDECLQVATSVVDKVINYNRSIDHYYDDSLRGDKVPMWAAQNSSRFVVKVGRLNFYNLEKDPVVARIV